MQAAVTCRPRWSVAASSRWRGGIAWVPIVTLLAGTAVGPIRPVGLVVLAAGFVAIVRCDRRNRAATSTAALVWGACMLVALAAAWSGVALPIAARDGSSCATPLAPFALYRAVGALLVLVAMWLVFRLVGARARGVGIVAPRSLTVLASVVLIGVIGLVATFVGPLVAEPFFGPLPIDLGNPWAILPALVFAIANATMEETAYRGVLLRWLVPSRGVVVALVIQAAVFGLAHGVGTDFAQSPLPVIAATALGGLTFGVIALRTGSLILPIALHTAVDIPIYFANACLRG
jgi:membrane protease YdiL (CAAX protease family)